MKSNSTTYKDAGLEHINVDEASDLTANASLKVFTPPTLTRHATLPLVTAGSINLWSSFRVGEFGQGEISEEGFEINNEKVAGL
jgi:hypothetical protein